MIGKHFPETSNKVELRINRVRINRAWPVIFRLFSWATGVFTISPKYNKANTTKFVLTILFKIKKTNED